MVGLPKRDMSERLKTVSNRIMRIWPSAVVDISSYGFIYITIQGDELSYDQLARLAITLGTNKIDLSHEPQHEPKSQHTHRRCSTDGLP